MHPLWKRVHFIKVVTIETFNWRLLDCLLNIIFDVWIPWYSQYAQPQCALFSHVIVAICFSNQINGNLNCKQQISNVLKLAVGDNDFVLFVTQIYSDKVLTCLHVDFTFLKCLLRGCTTDVFVCGFFPLKYLPSDVLLIIASPLHYHLLFLAAPWSLKIQSQASKVLSLLHYKPTTTTPSHTTRSKDNLLPPPPSSLNVWKEVPYEHGLSILFFKKLLNAYLL